MVFGVSSMPNFECFLVFEAVHNTGRANVQGEVVGVELELKMGGWAGEGRMYPLSQCC